MGVKTNKTNKAEKDITYDEKLCQLLDEYTQILVVRADNVGLTQKIDYSNGEEYHDEEVYKGSCRKDRKWRFP